jgi:hypothetical protein
MCIKYTPVWTYSDFSKSFQLENRQRARLHFIPLVEFKIFCSIKTKRAFNPISETVVATACNQQDNPVRTATETGETGQNFLPVLVHRRTGEAESGALQGWLRCKRSNWPQTVRRFSAWNP